ncbi:M56 family metallopeptidase [Simiduia aestuariiviva]|uniref:Protein TonB n=1 Tax=Simiduia aestuariiviva TaxID=1510459 RepID=A0A839UGC8_9GAMM|nr:M56 family metallopeptidase [Simiduia aestuariiviva]MBB3166942.1 TonB family protein [Simiduia aestuariiviva]
MLTINVLLALIVKPLLLIALAWLLIRQEQHRSASHQHLLTTALLWGLPLVLVISTALPSIHFNSVWLAYSADIWQLSGWQLLQQPEATALLSIYLFGLLFLLFYQALGLYLLVHVSRRGHICELPQIPRLVRLTGMKQMPRIKICAEINGPQTWGWHNAEILVPQTFLQQPEATQTLALLHELGHIQRRDWLVRQLTRVVCASFWFLPPVWWLAKQQLEQAERATDDWVLAHQGRPADYADLLVQSAKALKTHDLPTQALDGSPLFQRVCLLLNGNLDRQPREPQSALQALLLVGLTAGFLGVIQLQPQWLDATARPASTLTLLPKEMAQPATQTDTTPHEISRASYTDVTVQPTMQRHIESIQVIAHQSTLPPAGVTPDIRIGQPNIQSVMALQLVTPDYPKRALARGIEGTVKLEFSIDPNGIAHDIKTVGHANPLLAQAAISALSQSRFARPTLNQQPFTLTGVTEEYRFRIRTKPPDT